MTKKRCDILAADGGDFPADLPMSSMDSPPWNPAVSFPSDPPTASMACRLGYYDWIRTGGSRVNIDSVVNMFQAGGTSAAAFDAPPQATVLWRAPDLKHCFPSQSGMFHKEFCTSTPSSQTEAFSTEPKQSNHIHTLWQRINSYMPNYQMAKN